MDSMEFWTSSSEVEILQLKCSFESENFVFGLTEQIIWLNSNHIIRSMLCVFVWLNIGDEHLWHWHMQVSFHI